MIINGSAHLVDLDSEIIEVAGFGRFPGEAVRGQKIGSVFDLLGEKCLIARYALSDVQSNLKRGPQIVLPKDIAWMIYKSGLATGGTVVEAGCGSAALTLALAQAVAPNGKVITFENNPRHFKIAEKNLEMSPWKDLVEIRSSELEDKTKEIEADAIVLDLPNPNEPGMPLEEIYLASLILIGLSILLLFFYRDPYREIQDGIVSPGIPPRVWEACTQDFCISLLFVSFQVCQC